MNIISPEYCQVFDFNMIIEVATYGIKAAYIVIATSYAIACFMARR